MQILISVFRLVLLFLSNLGYWEFVRKKIGVHKYFAPSLTVVFQITMLFFSGLLNCMVAVTVILWLVGFVFLLISLKSLFKGEYKEYLSPGYIFLLVMTCVSLIALRGQAFTSYDNFTHWAVVVKSMLMNNRMPNYQDTIIIFQEYPLGSAVYIYYFAKIVSHSESIQMLAQVYMMLSMIMPVFVYLKKHQVLGFVEIILFTNFIFTFNIRINDLLVDTLLPLVGIAGWLFWANRDEENIKSYLFGVCLYLIAALQIKNSGVLFAGLGVGFLLVYLIKRKQNIVPVLASGIVPFITLYLWKRHCEYVFASAETSRHAMTAANYSSTFGVKSADEIHTIVTGMCKFSVTGTDFYLFVAALAVTLVVTAIFARDLFKESVKLVASISILYIIYCIGMLFMYLFSMSGEEAVTLASAVRYRRTIFIVVYVLLMAFYMKVLSETVICWKTVASYAIITALFIVTWRMDLGKFSTFLTRVDSVEREWFEDKINSYGVPQGCNYVAVIPKDDSGYIHFILRYLLMSPEGAFFQVTDPSQMEDIGNRQYLFVYDKENKIVNDWIEINYPDQVGKDVIVLGNGG